MITISTTTKPTGTAWKDLRDIVKYWEPFQTKGDVVIQALEFSVYVRVVKDFSDVDETHGAGDVIHYTIPE